MGIEQSGGTDTRVEGADEPQRGDPPPAPPPDRPGQPGSPSRLESLRAAREAQEARAAELESRQTAPPETTTDQRDEREDDQRESSPVAQQDAPEEPEETEATGEDDTSQPEASPPDNEVEQPGPADTGEATREPDAEQPEVGQPEEPEPATEPAEAPEPQPDGDKTEPEASEAEAPDENGESVPDGPAPEAATEQTPESGGQPAGHEGSPQELPRPMQAEQPEGPSPSQPPSEGDWQRTTDGQFAAFETPQQADAPESRLNWPLEPQVGVTRWASPVVHVSEREPGSHVEPRDRNAEGRPETPTTTDDETNIYRQLPDRVQDNTPDRGDPIAPEDDPADRNPFEPDAERGQRNRWENFDRANTSFDATKKVLKGVKDLQAKPPPTGQAEARTETTTMHRPDAHPGNPTDLVSNAIILTAAVGGWALQAYRRFKNSRRSEDAGN